MESENKKVYLNLPKYLYSDSDSDIELVPVTELLKFREFDRLKEGKFSKQQSYDNIKLLEDVYKNEGITSVLIIEYSLADNKVLLIEGNHRLNVALELGVRYLPARVVKRNSSFPSLQSEKAMKVIGVVPDKYGYVRSNLKPSAVGIQGTKSILTGNESVYENGGQILLAPNSKPSNLNPEQYILVRTPEFINWFGDWETLAKAKLLRDNIKGFYREIFKDNEEQFLFEMAVQCNTLDAKKGAIDVAGKELIDLAIKLYPNAKLGDSFIPKVSKVVDENGEPLVVYHGSPSVNIKVFNINNSERLDSGLKEYGSFFTTNKKVADVYSKIPLTKQAEIEKSRKIHRYKELRNNVRNNKDYDELTKEIEYLEQKGRIYPVFLNLKKIKEFDAKFGSNKNGYYNLEVDAGYKIATGNDAILFLKDGLFDVEKVDGIKANNVLELGGINEDWKDYIGTSFLVFNENPNQIKLADGTNTKFDINNPDIRFEDGGSVNKKNIDWLQTMPNIIKEMKKRDGDVQPESYYERMAKNIIGSHIGASIFNYGEAVKQKLITIDEAKKIIRSADFDIPDYIKELESEQGSSKSLITNARKMQLRNKLADIIKTLDYKTVDIHSGKSKEDLFIQRIVDMIYNGYDFKSKLDIERIATKEFGFDDAKKVRELTEYAILFVGRDISKENDIKETYDKLVSLYANQPYSTNRTVKSQELGQFSTPAPMAYLMGIYVGIDKDNYKEFEKIYFNYLNNWIDTNDKAHLEMIPINKTNWFPTELFVEYAKKKDFDFGAEKPKFLEYIKNGGIIPPIIVEKSKCSQIESINNGVVKLSEDKPLIDCYSVRDGIHRLAIYEELDIKYIPALVYSTASKDISRDFDGHFDNVKELEKFIGVSLKDFYNKNIIVKNKVYIEPTAGNGMLTIAGNPIDFVVNELDFNRYNNLLKDNYKQVLNQDATKPLKFDFKFDGLLANPPFATTKNDLVIDNYKISGLENQIIVNSLGLLKDDARGAFIIGGHTDYDNKGRLKSLKDKVFFSYLFSRYNVEDVINVSGTLYGRQGTTYPIRIILFNGRKVVPEGFFPLKNDKLSLYDPFSTTVINNFDELYKRFEKTLLKTR